MRIIYIIVAILVFGLLIAVHEMGHFLVAKACGVKVNEFALGMGPAIFKKQRGETLYALRALPIGGFCAMEGEDDDSADPRAFTSQPALKRLAVLIAGSFMNFLLGLIIVLILFAQFPAFGSNTVMSFADGFPLEGADGLMPGDRIVRIDGHRIFYADDFSTYMNRAGGKPVDISVIRDGKRLTLEALPLTPAEYADSEGVVTLRYGLDFQYTRANAWEKIKYGCYEAYNFVRTVWLGLSDLISGAVGVRDMSGVVGIVDIISETGAASPSAGAAIMNIAYLCAFIAVNLSVMNMLPIPALDGGRVFFLIVTLIIEKITGKHINPKYEGYIHAGGMALLMALMAFLVVNDILRIING